MNKDLIESDLSADAPIVVPATPSKRARELHSSDTSPIDDSEVKRTKNVDDIINGVVASSAQSPPINNTKAFLCLTPAQPKALKKPDRLDSFQQQITQLRKDHQAEIEILRSEVKSLRSELALVNTSASVGTSANNEIIELSEKVQKCSDALFTTVVARKKKVVSLPDSQSVKYLPKRNLTRMDENEEEADRNHRKNNLMISGLPESSETESSQYDETLVKLVFTDIKIDSKHIKSIRRFTNKAASNTNPGLIKVILHDSISRFTIIKAAKTLRSKRPNVFINPDLTKLEYEDSKRLNSMRKDANEIEKTNSQPFHWRKRQSCIKRFADDSVTA